MVLFFCLNGMISTYTAWTENMSLWATYNGFVAYVAMGGLFAIEWLIRQRVMSNDAA